MRSVRIATHCTEADVAKQHIEAARKLGMDVAGFLMMSHMTEPRALAAQAKLMERLWRALRLRDRLRRRADMDGYARAAARPMTGCCKPETAARHPRPSQPQPGRRQLASSPSQNGAIRVDASLAGMGAGAGNAPLEVFIAAADRHGLEARLRSLSR